MPPSLAALAKGHRFAPSAFVLGPQWASDYAQAVEDEATAGLGDALVPPMAVATLAVRSLLESAALPPGTVHLGQEVAFRRAVTAGEALVARAAVASRGERQGWVLMSIDLTVEDESGGRVMDGRATLTFPLEAA